MTFAAVSLGAYAAVGLVLVKVMFPSPTDTELDKVDPGRYIVPPEQMPVNDYNGSLAQSVHGYPRKRVSVALKAVSAYAARHAAPVVGVVHVILRHRKRGGIYLCPTDGPGTQQWLLSMSGENLIPAYYEPRHLALAT